MPNFEEQIKKLNENGYTVLRNAIPTEDIINMKITTIEHVEDNTEYIEDYNGIKSIPLAFTNPKFQYLTKIFTCEMVNEFLKTITNNQLIYTHHVDLFFGKGFVKWHDDTQSHYNGAKYSKRRLKYKKSLGKCPHAFGDIVDGEKYQIYRILIYFQDHQPKNGGLIVKEKSHLLNGERSRGVDGKNIHIPVEKGDVIIFDTRIHHRADFRGDDDRFLISWACGKDNIFTEYYRNGVLKRLNKKYKEKYELHEFFKDSLNKNGYSY